MIGRSKLLVGIAILAAGAGIGKWASDASFSRSDGPAVPAPQKGEVPTPITAGMEPRVAAALEAARRDVLDNLGSAEAWGHYGIVLDAHDLDVEATAAYQVARRLDPQEFRWVYFLGRTSEFGGGAGEVAAEALLREAISIRPDYAPAYVRLGDNLVRQGRIEEARDAFQRAVELDPRLGKAHRGLGQALLSLGDAKEALPHLERAATLVPKDGAAQASLARAYTLAGDRTKAREAAERSRSLDQIHTFPDPVTLEVGQAGISASVCFLRARELMDAGDYRGAIPNLEIALENLTQNPFIHSYLGRCYVETGQRDLAEAEFRRAIEMKPDMPDVLAQLGSFAASRGQLPEAIDYYRKSLTLEPENAKTLALLASALAQSGNLEDAITTYQRAREAGALDAVDENNWGIALVQRGNVEEGAKHFEEAVRLDPGFDNARFHLGMTLEERGRVEEAIYQYEQVARKNPQHRAAARLAQLRTASSR